MKKWGTFVRAQVRPGEATLQIRTEVENHGAGGQDVTVTSTVLDPSGKAVGKAVSAPVSVEESGERTCEQQLLVKQPALWSLEETEPVPARDGAPIGRSVDATVTRPGSASATSGSTAEPGLLPERQAGEGEGHAATTRTTRVSARRCRTPCSYYRVRKLQEMGCNALRTSHNPPTPELLDACDELGMLVLAETRMLSSSPEGLAQLENMVRRDRNHPSVFMWSLGNEESVSATGTGLLLLTALKRVAMQKRRLAPDHRAADAHELASDRAASWSPTSWATTTPTRRPRRTTRPIPRFPVIGTENVSAVGTRGIYATDPDQGVRRVLRPLHDHGARVRRRAGGASSARGRGWREASSGPASTTAGEPSPFQWPNVSSQYGVLDTCGFPKDTFYYYQSWWTAKPVLHVFPHWNWPGLEGQAIAVWVHSNLQKVELFLNGESLGAREMARDSHLSWNVPYALRAVRHPLDTSRPAAQDLASFFLGAEVLFTFRQAGGPAHRHGRATAGLREPQSIGCHRRRHGRRRHDRVQGRSLRLHGRR